MTPSLGMRSEPPRGFVTLPNPMGRSTVLQRPSRPSLAGWVSASATPVAVAGVTFWVAFDGGTYDLPSRNSLAIAAWWLLAVAVAARLWPRASLPAAGFAAASLLAAFALLCLAAAAWAASAERAVDEAGRALLYLGLFLVALLGARRGDAARWANGLLLGIGATALLALASRCFPEVFGVDEALEFLPSASHRLSYPLDYWNGLAILTALAFPLALRVAYTARTVWVQALAVAPVPALAGVVYLTSSRGGVIAAAAGLVAFVVLVDRRWRAAGAAAIAVAGSAASIAVLHVRTELVNQPGTAAAESQGASAALLVVVICMLSAGAYVLGERYAGPRLRLGRGAGRLALAAGLLLVVVGAAASHPVERFEEFKRAPVDLSNPQQPGANPHQEHLLSAAGTGRWQQWSAALDAFEAKPLGGHGPGSYEAWWAQHGSVRGYVRDGHSFYLETLAELGVLGLVLVLGLFGLTLAVAARRLFSSRDDGRATIAALAAAFVAYVLAAGIDWMWEMTVVSAVAVTAMGLLTGPATVFDGSERPPPRLRAWPRRLGTAACVAAAALVIYFEAAPLLADFRLADSKAAAESGRLEEAYRAARAAHDIEPWAASPYLQLALVQERRGQVQRARTFIGEALDRDDSDWRLWLVSARLAVADGDIAGAVASLRRAAELNPRSPLFAGFKQNP